MLSRLNRLSKLTKFSCLTAHPFTTSYFTPYYLLLTILQLPTYSLLLIHLLLTTHPLTPYYPTTYSLLLLYLLLTTPLLTPYYSPTYSLLLTHLLLTTPLLTPYYSPTYSLLIKRFLKGAEFVFAFYTTSPPCLKESEAITHQLGKGCSHTKQGDMQAAKHSERMHEES